MTVVKYLTKDLFTKLNNQAIKRNANRSLKPKFVKELDDSFKYPVLETFMHNDVEMRCHIAWNYMGETCWLDIPLADYDKLPEIEAVANA